MRVTNVKGGLLVCLTLAVALLALSGGASATDSVTALETKALAKLKSAQAAGRVDAATASSARAEIARAAHLIRTLPNGRGYHVRVALIEAASFRAALTMPRALELYGALKANDDYFSEHWAPADHTDYTDSDGLVYRYFAGYCFRFHPLADFGALNARVAAGDVEGTEALADALIKRGVYQKGGGIGWEYDFDFSGGRAPWLSGMAQAVAAQAFAGAAALVTDRSKAYMTEATAAERLIPKRLVTDVAAGPWIKLYGFSSLVVFNAQLQATLSLQSFAQASGDAPAAALAARMETAAYKMIPRFDTGYWSYYSLPDEPSPVAYHEFVVSLLKKLAKTDPRFTDAATRFAAYEKQPPAFQLDNAGVGQVRFWLSKPATVKLTSAAGPTKTLSLVGGWHTVEWAPKQAGIYAVHVSASDWLGNKTEFDALPVVRVGSTAAKSDSRRIASATTAVPGQPSFTVGAGLDDPSEAPLAQKLGLRLVRLGVAWPAASTVPDPGLVSALDSVPAPLGELVELNTGTTPADPTTTSQIATYAAALAQQTPLLRYLLLTPSPTAATAAAYSTALAAIATAVHAVAPTVAVGPLIDGSLTPKGTVAALGRNGIAGDVVAFRPAAVTSTTTWTTPNLSLLTKAFGTLPPLLIDGVTSPTSDPIAYTAAITANECSPNIAGVVFDHLTDNTETATTSGLYDATGTAKPAAAGVATAAAAAQRGTTVCPGLAVPAAASSVTYPSSVSTGVPVTLQLGCVRDCLYVATLVGANGAPVVATRGRLNGGAAAATISLPKTTLGQPAYTLDVRVVNRVNPGSAVTLASPQLPRS